MKVQAQSQGLEAFYADRMQRRDTSSDAALRQHFEQELNQVKIMMQAQGIAVPQDNGVRQPGAVDTSQTPPDEGQQAASRKAQEGPYAPPAPSPRSSAEASSQAANQSADPPPADFRAPAERSAVETSQGKQRVLFDETLAREAVRNTSASVSDGSGPNVIYITNDQDHEITVGKFRNQESTTVPSAQITLKPGETGALYYENGEAGIMTQADADGNFRPDASRLEYQSEADGSKRFPDVSYIDGRNASIMLTDGKAFNKGDSISIADEAPAEIITTDSAGNKTITGWYDGSTDRMQAGGKFMEDILGTDGAYLHPDDDRRPQGSNPMTATESSVLFARFGEA